MNILNTVTYTQWDDNARVHQERTTSLSRNYRLTRAGAQRILRASGVANAIVTRVDTMIDNR